MHFIKRWLPAAAWLGLVGLIIWLADTHRARWLFDWFDRVPGADKVAHFALVGGMAYFLNRALDGRRAGPVLLGSLIVLVVFTAEEISQTFIASRHFDLGDLSADILGIGAADWLGRRR